MEASIDPSKPPLEDLLMGHFWQQVHGKPGCVEQAVVVFVMLIFACVVIIGIANSGHWRLRAFATSPGESADARKGIETDRRPTEKLAFQRSRCNIIG